MEHALARFRTAADLSGKEAAKLLGVSRQTIHRIEAGRQQPSWKLVAKIIAVSDGMITADDFMPKGAAE